MRYGSLAFLTLIFLAIANFAQAEDVIDFHGVTLPANEQPIDLSKTPFSQFSGLWIGRWDSQLNHVLYISHMNDDGDGDAIYAIGGNPARGTVGRWFRVKAKVSGQNFSVKTKGLSAEYHISENGRLTGIFANNSGFAVLSRTNPSALMSANFKPNWTQAKQTFIETEFTENGAPVKLETIIYRPEGQGPFPLAVINHGSTGAGNDEAIFTHTWQNDWIAEQLNQRGWLVAFPQRRGRGKSRGFYEEGIEEDRSKGYSCETGRSLKGADRALSDIDAAITALKSRSDVSDAPLLMIGLSRGGILSSAYAGSYPDAVSGVINFSGGWMGEDCKNAVTINQTLFKKAANYQKETLWIYGKDDLFYSSAHSRDNFKAFQNAGGKGKFVEVTVAGKNNGHYAFLIPPLWADEFNIYLKKLPAK